jgi:4a-hydroxytetrahydrobiopterin dehydratase
MSTEPVPRAKDLVSPDALEIFMREHPGWVAQGDSHGLTLRRRFPFGAYARGLGFVVAAAEHAEQVNHHPDLTLGYLWVVAVLTTHVSKGITQRDLALAEVLDRLYLEHL